MCLTTHQIFQWILETSDNVSVRGWSMYLPSILLPPHGPCSHHGRIFGQVWCHTFGDITHHIPAEYFAKQLDGNQEYSAGDKCATSGLGSIHTTAEYPAKYGTTCRVAADSFAQTPQRNILPVTNVPCVACHYGALHLPFSVILLCQQFLMLIIIRVGIFAGKN